MSNDQLLLKTKLHVPPVRSELVSRPRLIERLETGRSGKVTLVSAPAGFGKTTLLGEWVTQLQDRAGWLALDEGDNDETHFWRYVIAALQMVEADLGRDALQLLRAVQRPATQVVLTALLNGLVSLSRGAILVLDDYHLISGPAIHAGVSFLLEHLPPQLHVVISTRADPPLPMHLLRARGQLAELRSADLRFTAGEAAEFLNRAMGLELTTEDVEALEARTEGWVVGLQLAALSLQGRPDAHEFITSFSGGHHYVLEYLTQEVVRRQPEAVQRFLMQTSLLDRLCAPLCNAVTGEDDGAAMLAYLQQRNLFIVALDQEHRWHRYHHLFADLLGNLRRKQWSAAEIREMHLRACEWHDENGLAAEAVRHALAAQDFYRTAQLIEDNSLAMVTRGQLTTLLRWIEALPEDVARSRPWLCIHQAWPLALAGKADAAKPLLEQVEHQVLQDDQRPDAREILGNVAAMRALLATMHSDMPRAVELAHQADRLLPADNLIPRNVICFVLASGYLEAGEPVKAGRALGEELGLGRASGNLWTIIRSLCDLADLEILQGRLSKAADLCREALQEAEARGARQFGTVGYVLVKLGEILYARDELRAAREHVVEGINLMQGWQQPYEMVRGYTTLATILQAQNDDAGAREALNNALEIQAQHPSYPRLNSLVRSCRVRLCLAQEGPDEAAGQAAEMRLEEAGAIILREQEQAILARLLVAQQRWDGALELLDPLAEQAEAGGRFGHLIEILVLQALARKGRGDTAGALTAMERALAMGQPEDYVRVFVEQGASMAALLKQATGRGIAAQYASKLLAALGAGELETAATASRPGTPSLVEPLTGRELDVLRLICEGLPNREIAERLTVTLNTVKKHSSHIYGKLGVSSRAQAIVRARELEIC